MFNCDKCGCCCRHLELSGVYSDLDRGDGTCKYLIGNICSIYENRPIKCNIEKCYELYFSAFLDKSEYYKLNLEECKKLKKLEE